MTNTRRSLKHSRLSSLPTRRHRGASRIVRAFPFRPGFDLMEDRTLLSSFVVSNTGDSGAGSLRQAIIDSNYAVGATNTIGFDISGTGVGTIVPLSPLPAISNPVLIDGTSQPGYIGMPLIDLSGSQDGSGDGLKITGPDVIVRGLDINGFSQGAGIHITGTVATGDWLYGNFLGTDPTGTHAEPNAYGVELDSGATNNLIGTNGDAVNDTVERNVISGNDNDGILITDSGTNSNVVAGNLIGTDVTGVAALGNAANGIEINTGALNTIGGTTAAARNVISGNGDYGISMSGVAEYDFQTGSDGAAGNFVSGNKIGTDITGTAPLENAMGGGDIEAGAAYGTLGGITARAGRFSGFDFAPAASSAEITLQGEISSPAGPPSSGTPAVTYRVDLEMDALVIAAASLQGLTARLALLNSQGQVIVVSDGVSSANPDDVIDEHLTPGTYLIELQGTGGSGQYGLTTTISPTSGAFSQSIGGQDSRIVLGDFNGDGIPDVATAFGVELGTGDGTFGPLLSLGLPSDSIDGLVAGDFNGDGKLDLAATDQNSNQVFVLLGNGNGTFQPGMAYNVGDSPSSLITGDFNGDGKLDLAVADSGSEVFGEGNDPGGVSVLLANGDGTFQPAVEYAAGTGPSFLVAGDFSGNGKLDIAALDVGSEAYGVGTDPGGVSLLMGNGDGTFQPATQIVAGNPTQALYGNGPEDLVAGDFRGNGKLDLAFTYGYSNIVTVLMNDGNGTFSALDLDNAGQDVTGLVAGDFNDDGRTDLVVINGFEGGIASVLLGNSNGTFQPPISTNAPGFYFNEVAGDLTGNGRLDLVSGLIPKPGVLLGNGDGTFQAPATANAVGNYPVWSVAGDFNNDGRLDLAVANVQSSNISVLLGNGDGTFGTAVEYAVGTGPEEIVAGDFNDDGRIDLAVTDSLGVQILLGNGDGTFQRAVKYAAGSSPVGIAEGDFNDDGQLDLAITDAYGVQMLLGRGDGTFQPPLHVAPIPHAGALVAADFNSDGKLDLAVIDQGTEGFGGTGNDPGGLYILLGKGDGKFQVVREFAAGISPHSLVAADFSGNGKLDIAVTDWGGDSTTINSGMIDPAGLNVLVGNGDGTFQPPEPYPTGVLPVSIQAADLNGDGKIDLVYADPFSADVSVLINNGDGTFRAGQSIDSGGYAEALTLGDFNGDGHLDLAYTSASQSEVTLLVGKGDGTFSSGNQLITASHSTPLVADLKSDGTDDVLVVDGAGDILYRQGVPGQAGAFEPPITINTGFSSRDIAVVSTDTGPVLASVDAQDNAISLYAWRNGGFLRIGSLRAGQFPVQITAANLTGIGPDDLVVRNAGDGTLSIFLADNLDGPVPIGTEVPRFLTPVTLNVGLGVSDVEAVDTTGSGTDDLVITNALTAQVSVLLNEGGGQFAAAALYRAGTGLSGIDPGGSPELTSLDATIGVAAGPLARGGQTDLVTINPGTYTLGVLVGLGAGRFANPATIQTNRALPRSSEWAFSQAIASKTWLCSPPTG